MKTLLIIGALAGIVLAGVIIYASQNDASASSLLGIDGAPISH